MAAGQQPDEHPLDQVVLPDDDPLHLEEGMFESRRTHAGFCSDGCDVPFFSGQSREGDGDGVVAPSSTVT